MRENYKHSEETKNKIREARFKFYANGGISTNGMKGKKHKPESLEKMRKANILNNNYKNFGDMSGSNNPVWKGGAEHRKETARKYRKNHPYVESYYGSKSRAKKLNIPHDISFDEFKHWYELTPKICVYCDLDINCKTENRMTNLSIDRKYNELGYIKNNICFACNRCNTVKGNTFTFDEMMEIGHKYIKYKN